MTNAEIINNCKEAILLSEKMKGCFFWNPPSSASSRRDYEKQHSMKFEFDYNEKRYFVNLETRCSCKNIYFYRSIMVDGIKKNITAIKTALYFIEMKGGK